MLLALTLGSQSALSQEVAEKSPRGPESTALGEPVPIPLAAPAPPEQVLQVAWFDPGASAEQRVERTRRAALEAGTWSFDAAARAALRGALGGDSLARAQAAVALAPELPLAHMALAEARWLQADEPMGALHSVVDALRAIAAHPEASVWFAGSALFVLAVGAVAGAGLRLVLVALRVAACAAHDLGHLAPGDPPGFARFALLGAALLLPLAVGEGAFGLALALLILCTAYGRSGQRVVLGVAAALLWAGLFPMARLASAALEIFPQDSVARAAYSLTQGLASPGDLARLEAAADSDPLALRALAMQASRSGHLGRADALYQRILAREPGDVASLNNAANVRLELGHMESALDLYGRALDLEESPVVLFNLSQAYVRSFHVDELNRSLAAAQRVDGDLVAQLTALQRDQNESFVVALPLGPALLWERLLAGGGGDVLATALRGPLAPGLLSASEWVAAAALAMAFALGTGLGVSVRRSRECARCGERMCPRCGGDAPAALCESCDCLFNHPEKTDRALRFARIEALRKRDRRMARVTTGLSVLVPGAAGILAGRWLLALLGALGFAVAAAGLWWRGGVVPDPLVAGAAGPAVLGGIAVLALGIHALSIATSLTAPRSGEP